MPKGFVDLLKRHSREVAAFEGEKADEFLRLLKETRDSLTGRLVTLGQMDNPIDAFRIRRILLETEAGIAALQLRAAKGFEATQEEAAEMAVEHIASEVKALSGAFDAARLDISISAQKVLADEGQGLLAEHFSGSVARYGLDLLNTVRRDLFVGLKSVVPTSDVVELLTRRSGPFGPVAQENAERLVRTETSQALGSAKHAGLEDAAKKVPGLQKVWLHVGSYPCPICMPLHGTIRPIDGTWRIKQGRKVRDVLHNPAHPACVCACSGMKPSWQQGLKKLGYLDQIAPRSKPSDL